MTVSVVCLSCSSCDSFLDLEPTNSADAESAIVTTDDAQVAINGVMELMSSSSYYGRNFIMYGEAKGGDMTIYSSGRGLDGLYMFNHTPDNNAFSGFWSVGYNCLLQVNNLIENIDKMNSETAEEFAYYKGEALTLRALIYFDLVRLYGLPYNYSKNSYGVPDVTGTIPIDSQLGRASVADNYNRIVDDLTKGESLMSSDKSENDGYVSYYANLAIQARVALFMEDYDKALTTSETIIDSKVFKLYEPSEWCASWAQQYGSESIFEIGMDSETDLGTGSLGYYMIRYHQKTSAQGWFLASDYFLNRLGEDPGDVRWGVMDNDEYWLNTGTVRKGACYKYIGGPEMKGDGKENPTAVDIKVIRLSEIYLIAAEASLHASHPDADKAATYLNAIRRRSPNLAAATASTISDDMILSERGKEFYGEGLRFFDMIRMNKTIEFNDDLTDVPVTYRGKTIDRTFGKIVLPIPQSEINANSVIAVQQNSAYSK